LNIYRIDITTDRKLPYVGQFQFFIDKKISNDEALEITTEAIEHYIEYLMKKDDYLTNRDDFYNLIHRGFIKLGKIYDYSNISVATIDENVHKVRPLEKAVKEDPLRNSRLGNLDVYAIDGTPSKGYVFCRTGKIGGNSEEYSFVFWENYSGALTHEIHIYERELSYSEGWNYETQRKRYSDTIATPENMFKMSYFHPSDEDVIEEKDYTYIPKQKNLDITKIKTESYDALYDGYRFNMEILFPSTLFYLPNKKMDEFEIPEFHKGFVDKINQILSNDIKYDFKGSYDYASLRYVPFEKINEVLNIVEEWSMEADKLGNALRMKIFDKFKPKDQ